MLSHSLYIVGLEWHQEKFKFTNSINDGSNDDVGSSGSSDNDGSSDTKVWILSIILLV